MSFREVSLAADQPYGLLADDNEAANHNANMNFNQQNVNQNARMNSKKNQNVNSNVKFKNDQGQPQLKEKGKEKDVRIIQQDAEDENEDEYGQNKIGENGHDNGGDQTAFPSVKNSKYVRMTDSFLSEPSNSSSSLNFSPNYHMDHIQVQFEGFYYRLFYYGILSVKALMLLGSVVMFCVLFWNKDMIEALVGLSMLALCLTLLGINCLSRYCDFSIEGLICISYSLAFIFFPMLLLFHMCGCILMLGIGLIIYPLRKDPNFFPAFRGGVLKSVATVFLICFPGDWYPDELFLEPLETISANGMFFARLLFTLFGLLVPFATSVFALSFVIAYGTADRDNCDFTDKDGIEVKEAVLIFSSVLLGISTTIQFVFVGLFLRKNPKDLVGRFDRLAVYWMKWKEPEGNEDASDFKKILIWSILNDLGGIFFAFASIFMAYNYYTEISSMGCLISFTLGSSFFFSQLVIRYLYLQSQSGKVSGLIQFSLLIISLVLLMSVAYISLQQLSSYLLSSTTFIPYPKIHRFWVSENTLENCFATDFDYANVEWVDIDFQVDFDGIPAMLLSFPDLFDISGLLVVENNPELTTLGLPDMRTCSGQLDVLSNPMLINISLPILKSILGFTISNNTILSHLRFPLLTTLSSDVLISSNPGLIDLSWPLFQISLTFFNITSNPMLINISFPLLQQVSTLAITSNPNLINVDLSSLGQLNTLIISDTGLNLLSLPAITQLDAKDVIMITQNQDLALIHLPGLNSTFGDQVLTAQNARNLTVVFADGTRNDYS